MAPIAYHVASIATHRRMGGNEKLATFELQTLTTIPFTDPSHERVVGDVTIRPRQVTSR